MEPTREIAEKLLRDKREAAAAMTFEQRAIGGVIMFDILIDAMRGVFRVQNPSLNDSAIEQLVIDRLRLARQNEARA